MTICFCCGEKLKGPLGDGCAACGARPVGPPLPPPERLLPSYTRAVLVFALGVLPALVFVVSLALTLAGGEGFELAFSSLVRAAEATAWRLRWTVLPVSLLAAWAGVRACRRIGREPARQAGLRLARAGAASAALVALAVASLVAVTIPQRLYLRELSRRAADDWLLHASEKLLVDYRVLHGTYPASAQDLKRLPDPDGSVAKLIAVMEAGAYSPHTDLAALASWRAKGRGVRRAARVRAARQAVSDATGAGLPLTNYELVLPGRDEVLGTADDLRIRDGVIEAAPRPVKKSTPAAAPSNKA